jgi:vacuolar iron transporter family protein
VDGLVTNAALIAGVGGGGVATSAIVLTGLAGLAAGAFSMGTGEYVSVTNQNELVAAEVAVERDMHARFPDAERALQLHTREELGVNPNELPSPLLAGEPRWWRSPSERSCRCCRTFLAYAP